MAALTEEQQSQIMEWRDTADRVSLMQFLQTWLGPLSEQECLELSFNDAQILQDALFDVAEVPDYFKSASLLVARIYLDQEEDDERTEDGSDFEDGTEENETTIFKSYFLPEYAPIPLADKKEILTAFINSKESNAQSLAFYILETIFPTFDKAYHQFLLEMILAALNNPDVHKEVLTKTQDLFGVMLTDFILDHGFGETLDLILRKLGFSEKLLGILIGMPLEKESQAFTLLSEGDKARYFALLTALAPTSLERKITCYLWANGLSAIPKRCASDENIQKFLDGHLSLGDLVELASQNMKPADYIKSKVFIRKCAMVLADQLAKADESSANPVYQMIVHHAYAGVSGCSREILNEQMDFFGFALAEKTTLNNVYVPFNCCFYILQMSTATHFSFVAGFMRTLYKKFPDEMRRSLFNLSVLPMRLFNSKILVDSGVWTLLAQDFFQSYFTKKEVQQYLLLIFSNIAEELQVFTADVQMQLYTSLIGTQMPQCVQVWAGGQLERLEQDPGVYPKRVHFTWNKKAKVENHYTATYSAQTLQFKEQVVAPDGFCAFSALGVDKEDVVAMLFSVSGDAQVRQGFSQEIRTYYFNKYTQIGVQEKVMWLLPNEHNNQTRLLKRIFSLFNLCEAMQRRIDRLQDRLGDKYPELLGKDLNHRLQHAPQSDRDRNELGERNEALAELNAQLDAVFLEQASYESYIQDFNEIGWGSVQALLQYTKLAGDKKICIWQQNDPTKMELTAVGSSHGDPLDPSVEHIIFKFDHFDKLKRKDLVAENGHGQHSSTLNF